MYISDKSGLFSTWWWSGCSFISREDCCSVGGMGLLMEQIQAALFPPIMNDLDISALLLTGSLLWLNLVVLLCAHTQGGGTILNLLTNVKQINIYRYVNDIYWQKKDKMTWSISKCCLDAWVLLLWKAWPAVLQSISVILKCVSLSVKCASMYPFNQI